MDPYKQSIINSNRNTVSISSHGIADQWKYLLLNDIRILIFLGYRCDISCKCQVCYFPDAEIIKGSIIDQVHFNIISIYWSVFFWVFRMVDESLKFEMTSVSLLSNHQTQCHSQFKSAIQNNRFGQVGRIIIDLLCQKYCFLFCYNTNI